MNGKVNGIFVLSALTELFQNFTCKRRERARHETKNKNQNHLTTLTRYQAGGY